MTIWQYASVPFFVLCALSLLAWYATEQRERPQMMGWLYLVFAMLFGFLGAFLWAEGAA